MRCIRGIALRSFIYTGTYRLYRESPHLPNLTSRERMGESIAYRIRGKTQRQTNVKNVSVLIFMAKLPAFVRSCQLTNPSVEPVAERTLDVRMLGTA